MPCYTYTAYLVITGTQCVHCVVRNISSAPHTTYARVRSWDSEYKICGGKSDIWTRFPDGVSVFPVPIIPPVLRTPTHIHAAFNRSANWRSLGAFEKQSCSGSREHSVEKYFHFSLERVNYVTNRDRHTPDWNLIWTVCVRCWDSSISQPTQSYL